MKQELIFWPVVVQVLLTAVLYLKLAKVKTRAVKAGEARREDTALNNDAWPDYVRKVSNNIRNQFELPVLFYALVVSLYALKAADVYAIALAAIFSISRLVHAYIHTGSNYVPHRLQVFKIGAVCVLGLVVLLARALLTTS